MGRVGIRFLLERVGIRKVPIVINSKVTDTKDYKDGQINLNN